VRAVRIALLHPTYWPEVRRGSERVVHDLGVTLAGRGHEVTLITSHRGPTRAAFEEGMRVIRARRPPAPPGTGVYEYHVANAPGVAWRLRRGGFDVVHAFFPVDAWVAVQLRRRGGPPVVATLHGIPTRRYLVARRYRLEMLRAIAAGADECTVLSEAAADRFRRYLLREPRVLAPGVVTGAFATDGASPRKEAEPVLFCPASLGDPRKRGELLLTAFSALRLRRPGLRLILAGGRDPVMSGPGPALVDGVETIDVESTGALADAYARASATVLPSVEEAFGLVLIESLAAGTPVVAARSGAGPEIVTDSRLGRLFDADDQVDLARAMEEAMELAADAETAAHCRDRAADYDWRRIVGDYEAIYESVSVGGVSGS
jgi:glycosyltransferase involved in cell wall biosynthesis